MSKQRIYNGYVNIKQVLLDENSKKCFIVHGQSLEKQSIYHEMLSIVGDLKIELVHYKGYTSNPKVEEVQAGVEQFNAHRCDFIIAVGGGSALDVAKCIKQQVNQNKEKADADYIKMLAMPTTAGTGSESTQFAVVYENGEKKSVDDVDILPDYVILEAELLKGLPTYQRKATMLDALCQAIESIWAKKATEESRLLATEAIWQILKCYKGYLADIPADNLRMLQAANSAGQAINITRTTAAHAMSYKLTSLYGAAHGHAVGACMKVLWKWMIEHNKQSDQAGLQQAYDCISKAFGTENIQDAYRIYVGIFDEMELTMEGEISDVQMDILVDSVNIQRLSNHPFVLCRNDLEQLYRMIG